jgi:hypothetical protein
MIMAIPYGQILTVLLLVMVTVRKVEEEAEVLVEVEI